MKVGKSEQNPKNIDFSALTGFEADADLFSKPYRSIGPNSKQRRTAGAASSNTPSHDEEPYNVFNTTETSTRLRPLKNRTKWTRRLSLDDAANTTDVTPLSKSSHTRPRVPALKLSKTNMDSPRGIKKRSGTARSIRNASQGLGSDIGFPIAGQSSKRYGITPPATHTPPTTHSRSRGTVEVISLDSSPEREQPPRKIPTNCTATRDSLKAEQDTTNVKDEPLSAEAIEHTVLRVSADNMKKGPISVPFDNCAVFHSLFASLISERKIRAELDRKISDITLTCAWSNNKSFGIRRDKPQDWSSFCGYLRKAWDKDMDRFEDGCCEIEVMIHVDE